jgi:peptidoglycan hydrolase-like protein with peptidoglycan-binding domain
MTAPAYAGERATRVVDSINSARHNHGLRALTVRSDLTAVATRQAQRMADQNRLFHNPNLTSVIPHWLAVGENVGVGSTAGAITRAFMGSPEHRSNILSSDYKEVGVGIAYAHGLLWVVEDFRLPDATLAARNHHSTRVTSHRLPMLRLGSRGSLVAWVQHRLHVSADGIFGPVTRHAVIRFKRAHHLHPTGVVGRRAWHALGR